MRSSRTALLHRRTLTTNAVRLRFAPSPTGALHVGGARTALFNFLFARKCELEGRATSFVVRIDDSDASRNVDGAEAAILRDLAWLGLRFGAPERCSDRDYAGTMNRLLETGHAYRDFGGATKWRDAGPAEVRPLLADAVPHAVRFRVPRPDHAVPHLVKDVVRDLRWNDVRKTLREDFVLTRRDGAPLYALCAAADDARDEITHVVRASEHASNALPQTLLLDALGAPRPLYAHCSLVVDRAGQKLSKRSATAATVAALRDEGCTPLGVAAYLAGLGGRAPAGAPMSLDDLASAFALEGLSAAPSTFDRRQLDERDACAAASSELTRCVRHRRDVSQVGRLRVAARRGPARAFSTGAARGVGPRRVARRAKRPGRRGLPRLRRGQGDRPGRHRRAGGRGGAGCRRRAGGV